MSRREILANYDIDNNGVITSLGKFEGEMLYVPYFWEIGLDGCADEDEDGVFTFDIDEDDLAEFPELAGVSKLMLEESEQGFVYSATVETA